MLISKFDLYNAEWLDLVFENRNKEYGAYELRQHHDRTMVRAMAITFLTVGALAAASLIFRKAVVHPDRGIVVVVQPPPLVTPPKKIEQLKPEPPKSITPAKPMPTVATTRFVPPVVVIDNKVTETPPTIEGLENTAIGPVTTDGVATKGNDTPDKGTPGPAVDNTVHTLNGLDLMPTPVGGENAWAKFLNRNLRFPAEAQDAGVSGKVILSFVIEKDGTLSDITVVRAAGHGFDEEALRVLKLAKAWKPGYQNGQPVRVRYNIPLSFQLAE